jgi:excisionase family DNA binding protein
LARLIIFGEPHDTRKWIAYANQIAARIADGRYPHGQWLPPLAKISADLGAAGRDYTLIRRALKEIHAHNLIANAEGTGYHTGDTEPDSDPPEELRHHPPKPQKQEVGPHNIPDTGLLTTAEVAAIYDVHRNTVTRWADAGKLTTRRTLGRQRRYEASEIKEHVNDTTRGKHAGQPP